MIKIAPSILSADFANLERDIQRISTADYVHVDVMDGTVRPQHLPSASRWWSPSATRPRHCPWTFT